eukprot:COSAG01_NODE_56059_length_321_cov_0.463964_1_plen_58_part_10
MVVVCSTYFVKGALGGVDCTLNEDGIKYLDIQPEVECDATADGRYASVRLKALVGLGG